MTMTELALDLRTAYRTMVAIRKFEERCQSLRERELIQGSIHLSLGQEAIPTGALSALGDNDRVIATYRGHGWAIACGVPLFELFAEVLGREAGTNGGRGGSAYLSAPSYRFLGENSIVGAGLPIACGAALAAKQRDGVVVVSFGDGATSQGATHEAMVMACAHDLPVVFVCENNGWSENTPISAIARVEDLSSRAAGYGMAATTIDGDDPMDVFGAIAEAARRARVGDGPSFVECRTHRLGGHYNADIEHYRPPEDKERAIRADAVARLRGRLLEDSVLSDHELRSLEAEVEADVEEAERAALEAALPDPGTARLHVVATERVAHAVTEPSGPAANLKYGQAVNEALRRELQSRPNAILFGEDIAIPGGVFGVTRRLHGEFGEARVFDTAIAESAILGAAVGASQEGLVPIVEIMWSDFLLVALDQLVNQAANVRYLHRGTRSAPMVVRCQQGVTPGSCAQHSQSLEALLAHIPGLHVGMPSNPQDAYAMLRAAVADPDPCVIIESRALYLDAGDVHLDSPIEPVGGARALREGGDIALVTWGRMVQRVSEAADRLATQGVAATVLDLRWLTPLDHQAIATAVSRTGKVIVVHEANVTGGFGAEVTSSIGERNFFDLDAPPRRMGAPDIRFPAAPVLQNALLPTADAIVAAALEMMNA